MSSSTTTTIKNDFNWRKLNCFFMLKADTFGGRILIAFLFTNHLKENCSFRFANQTCSRCVRVSECKQWQCENQSKAQSCKQEVQIHVGFITASSAPYKEHMSPLFAYQFLLTGVSCTDCSDICFINPERL